MTQILLLTASAFANSLTGRRLARFSELPGAAILVTSLAAKTSFIVELDRTYSVHTDTTGIAGIAESSRVLKSHTSDRGFSTWSPASDVRGAKLDHHHLLLEL